MTDLSALHEGDEIAILSNRCGPAISRVAKVNKRYLVDDLGRKWAVKNGQESPRDPSGWSRLWAEPATDVHRALVENAKTRAKCRRVMDDLAPRAARDTNLAMRILEALKPVLNDDDVDA